MRVTGIIKNYIESEVDKKYKKKLETIPDMYKEKRSKCIEEIEEIVKECNNKAIEITKKHDMFYGTNIVSFSRWDIDNKKLYNEHRAIVEKLKEERDNKIAEIILSLELGETTKKEITDVLNNVEF